MPLICQVGTRDHNSARACPKMPGWESSREFTALIWPEYHNASDMPGCPVWNSLGNLVSSVCLGDVRLGSFRHTEGRVLDRVCPLDASLGSVWQTHSRNFLNLFPISEIARQGKFGQFRDRGPRLGNFWETQSHNIARACLQDARLANFWESQIYNTARICVSDS